MDEMNLENRNTEMNTQEMNTQEMHTSVPDAETERPQRRDVYADGTAVDPSQLRKPAEGTPLQTGAPQQNGMPQQNAAPQGMQQQGVRQNGNPYLHGAQNGQRTPYEPYRYNQEWQRRQVDPQPYQKGTDKKKNFWKNAGIVAVFAVIIGLIGGLVYIGSSAIGAFMNGRDAESYFAEAEPHQEAAAEPKEEEASRVTLRESDAIEEVPTRANDGTRTVADVAEEAMPAMVAITNISVQQVYSFFGETQSYEVPSAGSGIIVGQTDDELLIATNEHVISDTKSLSVAFVDETAATAVVKGADSVNDLAIIAVSMDDIEESTKDAIRVISIGDSDAMRIGEQVVAIGNALGYGQSVSAGVVSALNRTVTVENENHTLMQTDAAINPGNSGGALLNMKGELIGINEVKYVSEDAEGIGYAIPITQAKPILDDLMNRKTRTKAPEGKSGYLGINCITVTEQYSTSLNIPIGVYVDEVTAGGAAEKAGVKVRDIITAIDGNRVESTKDLINELTYYEAGTTVDLVISRLGADNEYEEITLSVTLDERPAEADLAAQEENGR